MRHLETILDNVTSDLSPLDQKVIVGIHSGFYAMIAARVIHDLGPAKVTAWISENLSPLIHNQIPHATATIYGFTLGYYIFNKLSEAKRIVLGLAGSIGVNLAIEGVEFLVNSQENIGFARDMQAALVFGIPLVALLYATKRIYDQYTQDSVYQA